MYCEGGLLRQMTKAVLERALAEELTEHLGYEPGDPGGHGRGTRATATRRRRCCPRPATGPDRPVAHAVPAFELCNGPRPGTQVFGVRSGADPREAFLFLVHVRLHEVTEWLYTDARAVRVVVDGAGEREVPVCHAFVAERQQGPRRSRPAAPPATTPTSSRPVTSPERRQNATDPACSGGGPPARAQRRAGEHLVLDLDERSPPRYAGVLRYRATVVNSPAT